MLRIGESFARSDTGRQRRANEDSYLAAPPVYVVADGMGGARAGEVASRLAIESYARGLAEHGEDRSAAPEQRLADRAREANSRIHELSRRETELQGMGTTLTAAWVEGEEVSIAHVGDSRAYCLRDGELMALTDDHSLVGELVRQGRLTPEEASEHPQRSIITRALGPEADVAVDTRTFRARAGDVYLLCSDGLTSMVDEPEVRRILARDQSLERSAEDLIAAANEAGGSDNITVVLFAIEQAPEGAAAADMPTTIGDAGLAEGVRAGLAGGAVADPPRPATSVRRRSPRMPGAGPTPRRRRRVPVTALVLIVLLALVLAGGYIASQTVYFVGTNSQGLVTLYRGLPYDLPAGVHLYTQNYVSGVTAGGLVPARRNALLNHKLRSRDDAVTLVRQLELGRLAG